MTITKYQLLKYPIVQKAELSSDGIHQSRIDLGRHHLLIFAAFGNHLSQRIDDHAVTGILNAGIPTGAVAGNQIGQIFMSSGPVE